MDIVYRASGSKAVPNVISRSSDPRRGSGRNWAGWMLAPTLVIVLCTADRAQAQQVISLQYVTNGAAPVSSGTPATAGAVPEGNFNSSTSLPYVNNTGSPYALNNLKDSTGAVTGISETTASDGGYDSPKGSGFVAGTGDYNLFSKFALGNFNGVPNITLTVTGLDSTHLYDLYAYVNGNNNGLNINGTVGSLTYYLLSASPGAYVRGSAVTAGSAQSANYFEFSGLTSQSSETLTLGTSASNGTYFGLDGFQLVDNGPSAPEPCSIGILGASAAFMLLRRRRSRSALPPPMPMCPC